MVEAVLFRLLNVCFLVTFFSSAKGQNYLANADFEALNNCTEYHQDCSSEAWFYIKPAATPQFTPNAVPRPFSGIDLLILPVENIYAPIKKRQYVYTKLCCPLQKGKNYKLSFYINTGGKTFYGLDFYFRNKEFTTDNFFNDSVASSIHISDTDIVNELKGWNFVQTTYTATGNERFFLLGNLSKTPFNFSSYQRMNKAGDVFYFLDDIALSPSSPEPLCEGYKATVDQLFAQNLRHTENVLIEKEETAKTDTLIIPAVFFETDKDILKPVFKKLLDSLVLNFSSKKINKLVIEGHTDNKGTLQRNIVLSQERAESVAKYILRRIPSLQNNISFFGNADKRPVADNLTEKGRAKNRRVEIIISYSLK